MVKVEVADLAAEDMSVAAAITTTAPTPRWSWPVGGHTADIPALAAAIDTALVVRKAAMGSS